VVAGVLLETAEGARGACACGEREAWRAGAGVVFGDRWILAGEDTAGVFGHVEVFSENDGARARERGREHEGGGERGERGRAGCHTRLARSEMSARSHSRAVVI